jgi:hypothetical protein
MMNNLSTREVTRVGLKLIGVYFAVQAFPVVLVPLVMTAKWLIPTSDDFSELGTYPLEISFEQFAFPVGYFSAAFLLIRRTEGCLNWVLPEENRKQPADEVADEPK